MLWILLPAYNEEESLPKLLPQITQVFVAKQIPYRIVVVNDGSLDNTADILANFEAAIPLTTITHKLNRGLGETERDGFEYIAEHCHADDVIIRMDCDNTHKPDYIFDLLNKLSEGYDVVNTSRFQPGGDQLGLSMYRRVISRFANIFMQFIFGISGVYDYSCGYRAYRGQVIQDAIRIFGNNFIQLRGLGFTSTLEMLVKLHILGCHFAEIPFVLRYDLKESGSKMVTSITTLGYLTMAIMYHWPYGGWKKQYQGLSRLYRESPDRAFEKFSLNALRRYMVSRISL
ncbi:MAG: glycosyltransferase family 2 protein [Anaerolineae bacterium]|nr:glycosyltransferase family 2 protein [Anaerolineae bacterium]